MAMNTSPISITAIAAAATTGAVLGFAISHHLLSRATLPIDPAPYNELTDDAESKAVVAAVTTAPTHTSSASSPDTTLRLLEASHFCSQKHQDQRRKNRKQTPYSAHPISVARRLVQADVTDPDVLIAALLHDTVEDTETSLDEIEAIFGTRVSSIVDEVTDDKSLPKLERKRLQIENAPLISREAKLVKLSDKLDNLTDLLTDTPVGWAPQRVLDYFNWAAQVVDGLRGSNGSLERQLDQVLMKRHVALEVAASYTGQ